MYCTLNKSHENQQWTDPTNKYGLCIQSLIFLCAIELCYCPETIKAHISESHHCTVEARYWKPQAGWGRWKLLRHRTHCRFWSFHGISSPVILFHIWKPMQYLSNPKRCSVHPVLLPNFKDRWWGCNSFDFLCHRAWKGTKWDVWVQRHRGWQEEEWRARREGVCV